MNIAPTIRRAVSIARDRNGTRRAIAIAPGWRSPPQQPRGNRPGAMAGSKRDRRRCTSRGEASRLANGRRTGLGDSGRSRLQGPTRGWIANCLTTRKSAFGPDPFPTGRTPDPSGKAFQGDRRGAKSPRPTPSPAVGKPTAIANAVGSREKAIPAGRERVHILILPSAVVFVRFSALACFSETLRASRDCASRTCASRTCAKLKFCESRRRARLRSKRFAIARPFLPHCP